MIPNRDADIIKKYQLTNLLNNNNKWWTIEWWKTERIAKISYGRVGQSCARPAIKEDIDERKFNKLIRDREKVKEEGQYKEVKTGVQQVIAADTTGLSPILVDRVTKIFRAANENIDSYLNTNISDLAPEQIVNGRLQLAKVQKAYETFKSHTKISYDELIEEVRSYYEYIPTKLPYKIDATQVALNLAKNLADEEEKLQQLEAAVKSYSISTKGGSILDQLGCQFEQASDVDYKNVKEYFDLTKKHNEYNNLNVAEIWKINVPNEEQDFNSFPVQSNIKLLWHGTTEKNVRHICRTSLIIPKYATNGSLFSRGVYFADVATKSLGYTGYGSEKYLFLADVILGNQYKTRNYLGANESIPKGYDSLFAEAGKKIGGVWNGSLAHNEFVIYNIKQKVLRYLVIVK